MFNSLIEGLESRLMLAAQISSSLRPPDPPIFLHDGILTIRGGPGKDRISLSTRLPPSFSSEHPDFFVHVHLNDQNRRFHRDQIQLIEIDARAGDDLIMLRSPPEPCELVRALPRPGDRIDGPCLALIIAGPAIINAGDGNDTIYGSDLDDTIDAGAGNDLIYGMSGSDRIFAKAGNDTIHGGGWPDYIRGGTGNDTAWDPDKSSSSIEHIRRTPPRPIISPQMAV